MNSKLLVNRHIALLVVDVQNGFINANTAEVPNRIQELIECADYKHRIFTRFINTAGSQYERLLNWDNLQGPPETAIVDSLATYPTAVIDKNYYTSLTEELLSYALTNGITTFHIVGIDTDVCVLKTAVDIFEHAMTPIVFAQCCMSSAGQTFHQNALELLPRFIGKRQLVNDYREYLGSHAG